MIALSDLVAQDVDALTVRTTGKTIAQWDQVWRRRRVSGLQNHRLNGNHAYTADERDDAIRFYDLDTEDFNPVVAKVGQKASLPADYAGFDRVTIDNDRATEMIEAHRAKAESMGQSCPPLAVIVLYQLRQSALASIHAESRKAA